MSQSMGSFAELLGSAAFSAVHLEMRDGYMPDDPGFLSWGKGHRFDPSNRSSWWRPWLDVVTEATARGVVMRRARIVSEPVSDYVRYEYDTTFTNIAAGEQVRWLPRRQASDIPLPGNDFWMFDDRLVQFNVFDGNGNWVHTDHASSAGTVALCSSAFETVWERGVEHGKYII